MSEFVLHVEKLFHALGDPEYRFLLLEPLIIFGIAFGVITFLVSYFLRAPKVQTAALIFIGLSAMAHVPYMNARTDAQPRMEQVYQVSSPSRVREFKKNTISWKADSWKYLTLAAIAGASILVGTNRNRLGVSLSIATILFGLIAVKSALWMHYQDSMAYHPNLKTHQAPIDTRKKYAPPPPSKTQTSPGSTKSTANAGTSSRSSSRQSTRITQPIAPSSTTLSNPVESGQPPRPRNIMPVDL